MNKLSNQIISFLSLDDTQRLYQFTHETSTPHTEAVSPTSIRAETEGVLQQSCGPCLKKRCFQRQKVVSTVTCYRQVTALNFQW